MSRIERAFMLVAAAGFAAMLLGVFWLNKAPDPVLSAISELHQRLAHSSSAALTTALPASARRPNTSRI